MDAQEKRDETTSVIVTYRNVKAKEQYDAANAAQPTKRKNKAKEDVVWKGRTKETVALLVGSTVKDLQAWVVDQLKDAPPYNSEKSALESKNIWVFYEEKSTVLDGETKLVENSRYFALEVFKTTPTDLYRTVTIEDLEPATLCLPENRDYFTNVSPLFTSYMKQEEFKFPWLQPDGTVCGISVYPASQEMKDAEKREKEENAMDPLNDLVKKMGETSISLARIRELAEEANRTWKQKPDDFFLLLKSHYTHKGERLGCRDGRLKGEKGTKDWEERRNNKQATVQDTYYRFELKKHTELSEIGMVAVFDNSDENHWSLVLLKKPSESSYTELMSAGKAPFRVWIPESDELGGLSKAGLRSALMGMDAPALKKLLSPDTTKDHPVVSPHLILMDAVYVPFLAPMFKLFDFVVKAKAEPVPLECSDDDDENPARVLSDAALILFERLPYGTEDIVYSAIRALEYVGYDASKLGASFQQVLIRAMNDVDVSDDELEKVLSEGIGVLKGAVDGAERDESVSDLEAATKNLRIDEEQCLSTERSVLTKTPCKAKEAAGENEDSHTPPDKGVTGDKGDPDTPPTTRGKDQFKQAMSPDSHQTTDTDVVTTSSASSARTSSSTTQPPSLLDQKQTVARRGSGKLDEFLQQK